VAVDGEQRWVTRSRGEQSEACVRRMESGGRDPIVPTCDDKAAHPCGSAVTGGIQHWRHHRMVGAVTGGDWPNDVRRWDRVTRFPG
jgi:hypothetical protein